MIVTERPKAATSLQELPVQSVSIIIAVFNQWEYTRQCLQSVLANSPVPGLEVIVVNNGSTDETEAQLSRCAHPSLKVISLPVNLGFAAAVNHGCSMARGEYLVLLNNDTIVPPGWLERLLRPLASDRQTGLAGPLTNHSHSRQQLDLAVCRRGRGADLCWLRELYRFNSGLIASAAFLSFFCVAMHRNIFESVGCLDERFGLGLFEDNDYCERVKAAGYSLCIALDTFVYHHGGTSFLALEAAAYNSILQKNQKLFEQKWQKKWQPAISPLSFSKPTEEAVAAILSATGKSCVLLINGRPWWGTDSRCTRQTEALLREGKTVIVTTPAYYGRKIYGLRQAGPNFFLTNDTALLSKSSLAEIIAVHDCSAPGQRQEGK